MMGSKDEVKKEEIIASYVEIRGKILQAIKNLPIEKQEVVFLGSWTVIDLLAHLVGWDYANLLAVMEIVSGQVPSFYQYHDHDWKSFNSRLVTTYRQDDLSKIIGLTMKSHQALLDCLKNLPAQEYPKDRGLRFKGYKIIISRLLLAEIADEEKHLAQISNFFGETNAR